MYVRRPLHRRYGRALAGVSSQPAGRRVYHAMAGMPVATLSGVSSRPYGPRVYHAMAGIFGDDTPSILEPTVKDPETMPADPTDDMTIKQKLDEMLRRQKIEADARRLSQIVAVAGALFAAARLGIIWLPLIKQKIRPGSTP